MSLLDFARGPGMRWALIIFVAGAMWRLVGMLLLRGTRDLSEPRNRASWKGLRLILLRSWPRREFLEGHVLRQVLAYTYHVGFLLVLFFYVPHILFFRNLFEGLVGAGLSARVHWPSLPTAAISFIAVNSLAALVVVLIQRLVNPVKRLLSNFDDYCSALLTAVPFATGIMAYGHLGGVRYETLLAWHLLSVEALLAWFPWGKLMHAFTVFAARGVTGVLFERRGAAL